MQHNIRIDLIICFKSKWHSGSGESGLLMDRLIRKDARNRPYLPGSTLKGVIRESCEKLSRRLGFEEPADPHETDLTLQDMFHPLNQLKSPVDRIFGNKYESGNLFFRDARLDEEPPYGFIKEQSRICKHRELGTAKEKHLFSTQYTIPLTFRTKIEGHHDHLASVVDEDPPCGYCLLIASIMNIDKLGGDKSTGSGQVEILFDSIEYNGKDISNNTDMIFEYLEPELCEEALNI